MSLKKLTELAKRFQTKLAQDPFSGLDPEQLTSMPQEELQDRLFGPSPSKNTPVPIAQPAKPINAPALTKSTGLPVDIREKLNYGAPGLKGVIYVIPDAKDPKSLRIYYNTERWTRGNETIKRILINALPGYNVFEVVGHQNPTWTTNYY